MSAPRLATAGKPNARLLTNQMQVADLRSPPSATTIRHISQSPFSSEVIMIHQDTVAPTRFPPITFWKKPPLVDHCKYTKTGRSTAPQKRKRQKMRDRSRVRKMS